MDKTIILLACSRKMSNFCVAGIDSDTGHWVRIVSEDSSIQHAIRLEDMSYENGSMPQMFDIIRIQCKHHSPTYYQPENWVFDNHYYWQKVGCSNITSVLKMHSVDTPTYIFYDSSWKVEADYISQVSSDHKHSLTLIRPNNLKVCVESRSNRLNQKSMYAQFNYNGNYYNYIKITDPIFEDIYSGFENGTYTINGHALLVLSLADIYKNYHYKLVATILNI